MNNFVLTTEQATMLEFALRWQPYGGGDSGDILVKFGLTDQAYFTRLALLLANRSVAAGLDPAACAEIRATCRRRLARARTSRPTNT
ncbi:DUF3263 domain-containing protein [Rhodococcoides fascians]|uniref:DUF3263 domain-containing protein n=1 Tax=Rhodococcoides fascians TaxID=1828 RepID=UPI0012D36882|nr:DUF3263 domain-containing protein [Rhodococcus fascians]